MSSIPDAGIPVVGLDALQEVVDHDLAYAAVELALGAIANEEMDAAEELALKLRNDGELHIKGGWLTSQPSVVFKLATGGFPNGGNSGCSLLIDAETGKPSMILDDGGYLTEMRTAAAGAVAANRLALAGPLNVAILGTGLQARFQLEALRNQRELSSVSIWGRTPAKAQAMAEEVSATAHDTIAEAVANADLIVTTTTATDPILFAEHLRPGVHITAMGADMLGKRELAADVFDRATLVVADDITNCSHVGELQHVPEAAANAVSLAGLEFDRSATDITIADQCGLGAYDAAIAALALERLI